MDQFIVNSGLRLVGEVTISGAKNAALPELCASILAREPITLHNVPNLHDIKTMLQLLDSIGVKATWDTVQSTMTLDPKAINSTIASYDLVKTMRASILVLGPLLARFGEARVSLPGGCAIGSRPVDQHIKGLEAMGADITLEHGYIVAKAQRLKGARIVCDMITVTGTENLMMAATLAEGETVIINAAREPEVIDLAQLLIKMGACITGHGTHTITIQGVEELHNASHTVVPDRIEAGTFLAAVAATGGDVLLRGCDPTHLMAALSVLHRAGVELTVGSKDLIHIRRDGPLRAVSFSTGEHPGFPTDLQAQFMALNCVASGTSTITENIFENRFMHVGELLRMGADINTDRRIAVVQGGRRLTGAKVMATDLRAGAGLVIAGLVADGETTIDRIYHIDRGYDKLETKLVALGASILRV